MWKVLLLLFVSLAYGGNYTEVAEKALSAVVAIRAEYPGGFLYQVVGKPLPENCTGFLVSSDGYIITNANVVGMAEKITVTFYEGSSLLATLVKADGLTGIALVKVEGEKFPYLTLGDSDALQIGEEILVIGHPYGIQFSLAEGIVSKKTQDISPFNISLIQIYAALYPGNVGSPILNMKGEVVGVCWGTFRFESYPTLMSLVLPSNIAKKILEEKTLCSSNPSS